MRGLISYRPQDSLWPAPRRTSVNDVPPKRDCRVHPIYLIAGVGDVLWVNALTAVAFYL